MFIKKYKFVMFSYVLC